MTRVSFFRKSEVSVSTGKVFGGQTNEFQVKSIPLSFEDELENRLKVLLMHK